jgi:hypothetical protein
MRIGTSCRIFSRPGVARADEEYDVAVVEAARVPDGSARVTAESF